MSADPGGAAPAGPAPDPTLFVFAIVAATALGGWLRLHDLGAPSFWVDEFYTVARAGADPLSWNIALGYLPSKLALWSLGTDLARVTLDDVPAWQSLGVTEYAARLGPCLVGVASIPLLAVLTWRVFGPFVAAAASLLLALLPFHVYWSQMARFYTTEFLLVNACLLCFMRAAQTGRFSARIATLLLGLLAFACHYSALFPIGAALGAGAFAWWIGPRTPQLARALAPLAGLIALCLGFVLASEAFAPPGEGLERFSKQSWAPSLPVLAFGFALRFEPVLCVAAAALLWTAWSRREALRLVLLGVAFAAPAGVLALVSFFPIAPRYVLACSFSLIVLAALWCEETGQHADGRRDPTFAVASLAVLSVAVGLNSWLYTRDDAGARARWREAYATVARFGRADDPVYVGPGRYQAEYYLQRRVLPMPEPAAWPSLPPGSWLVHRARGSDEPEFPASFEVRGRFAIPSKPWSWVVRAVQRS